MNQFFKTSASKLLAVVILAILYQGSKLPEMGINDQNQIKKEFHFSRSALWEPIDITPHAIREVHPQYKKIAAWISSVGAAITITDLDNNGMYDDFIQVDPRYDKIMVMPAPGTGTRFKPYYLEPNFLFYDSNTMAPMGSLAYDFNADGMMDVLVYYWGRTPIIFYQKKNGFDEAELCDKHKRWFSNAATLADFDGDGHVDILVANYFPDGSDVLNAKSTDRIQTMQHSMSRAYNGGSSHFFLNARSEENGKRFVESDSWDKNIVFSTGWTLAVGALDITGDLLPEIYFANDFGPDRLLYNCSTPGNLDFKELSGRRKFTDIKSGVLGKDSFKGMGIDFGDIDGDGLIDIYVSNITSEYALEESNFAFINTGRIDEIVKGVAPFVNQSEKLGLSRSSWAWEAKLADFNNDGENEALQATGFIKGKTNRWPELQELAMGNDELLAESIFWPDFGSGTDLSGTSHNPFFTKDSRGKFFDISELINTNQNYISRGIAVSDIDHDGDLDFAVANQWQSSFLYTNESFSKKSYIGLSIRRSLSKDQKDAIINSKTNVRGSIPIGAIVRIRLDNGKTLIGYVDGGNGHSGKNSNEVFFGVGTMNGSAKVEIQYRDMNGSIKIFKVQLQPGWYSIIL